LHHPHNGMKKNKNMFMIELDLKILPENKLILQQILLKNIN